MPDDKQEFRRREQIHRTGSKHQRGVFDADREALHSIVPCQVKIRPGRQVDDFAGLVEQRMYIRQLRRPELDRAAGVLDEDEIFQGQLVELPNESVQPRRAAHRIHRLRVEGMLVFERAQIRQGLWHGRIGKRFLSKWSEFRGPPARYGRTCKPSACATRRCLSSKVRNSRAFSRRAAATCRRSRLRAAWIGV